jgi:hypothetical protein
LTTGRKDWRDQLDLAVLEVPPEPLSHLASTSFLSLRDLDPITFNPSIQPKAHYALVGYPATLQSTRIGPTSFEGTIYTLLTVRSDLEDYYRLGLDPTTNLLLGFRQQQIVNEAGATNAPALTGSSGGGIWRLPRYPHGRSAALLSAIGIEWLKDEVKGILATHIGPLIYSLYSDDPESPVGMAIGRWADGAI